MRVLPPPKHRAAGCVVYIVTPQYQGPLAPWTTRDQATITDLIVHHSAGPKSQTPQQIEAFEISRGDNGMPYTWLVDDAGVIYTGRPSYAVSAATYGRNVQSVAVCVIGDFQTDDGGFNGPISPAAWSSLCDLAVYAHRQIPSIVRTIAHRDVAGLFYPNDTADYATACCGDQLYARLPELRAYIAKALGHG